MHTLYYSPGACSLAPHIVLEEIGKPYKLEHVSAKGGAMTNTPQWRAVNPKGRVPALSGVEGRIGGAPDLLTEAHAIMVYLARSNPQARLMPTEPAAEARAIEWINWLSANVHAMTYGQIWRPQRFVHEEGLFPAVKARGMDNVREQYAYIESLLGDGRGWALPQGYGVVDPYLLVFYRWGRSVELDMSTYRAWSSHTRRMLERPAVQRAFDQEQLPRDV